MTARHGEMYEGDHDVFSGEGSEREENSGTRAKDAKRVALDGAVRNGDGISQR